MKNNSGSPEERLLRLIRRGRDAVAKGPATQLPLKIPRQKILAGILVFACLNLFYSLIYPVWAFKSVKLPRPQPEKMIGPSSKAAAEVRPLDEYLAGIRPRQIFGRAVSEDVAVPLANVDTDLAKDYDLVGVVFGNGSQAIVQDKRSRQTIYLQKDQTLEGFKVYDIQEGKVLFDRNGEKYELRV